MIYSEFRIETQNRFYQLWIRFYLPSGKHFFNA